MKKLWENQLRNRFLWVPILMALGAAMYFTLPFEPRIPFVAVAAIIAFAVCVIRKIPTGIRAAALFAFGFLYANAFTIFTATPVITRGMRDAHITATVRDIDYTVDKARIYLDTPANQIGARTGTATVRVSVARDQAIPAIGDKIDATVTLFRMQGADAPGAFDYARWAYFNGISATGYMTDFRVIENAASRSANSVRTVISARSDSMLTDALVLGYKNTLDADSRQIWTNAGVAHVWSISGFHITLLSGWLFVIFYTLFRAIPFITRRIPARIPATICAWVGLTGYLIISGAGVATVRAFLMASLMFVALLVGRTAISMRNVAIAFCAIFLMNPHYVMQAGFQLSFAAIFGLIWFWGEFKWMPHNKILRALYAALMTAVVATLFTAPFVAAHFHSIPVYGVIGNLILLPLFSVVVMPMVMVGTMTAMFGLHLPLDIAQNVYDFAFQIANYISAMPHATITVPNVSNLSLTIMVLGLASLMFVRPVRLRVNYMIATALVICGIAMTAFAPRPIFYSTADTELIAFRDGDKLVFNKSRASNHFFTFNTWRQMNGERPGDINPRAKAVRGMYEFATPRFRIVYIQKYVPLAREIVNLCGENGPDYLVSYFRIDAPNCRARILHGGFVMYPSGRITRMHNNRIWNGVNNRNR